MLSKEQLIINHKRNSLNLDSHPAKSRGGGGLRVLYSGAFYAHELMTTSPLTPEQTGAREYICSLT